MMIFLSHCSQDKLAVRILRDQLQQAMPGVEFWFDESDLNGGEYIAQLAKAIEASDVFLLYMGKGLVGDWQHLEINHALKYFAGNPDRFRIVPVFERSREQYKKLPPFAGTMNGFQVPPGDAKALNRLVSDLRNGPQATQLPTELRPFHSLDKIDTNRSHLYFGRDKEILELVERVRHQPIVAVVGDSGIGKSSFIRAGLVPAALNGALDNKDRNRTVRRFLITQPGPDPIRELSKAIFSKAKVLGLTEADAKALADLRADSRLADLEKALQLDVVDGEVQTLLVVDQFEELVLQTPKNLRFAFASLLTEIARCTNVKVVLTLRRDCLALFRGFDDLFACISDEKIGKFLLGPLSNQGVRDAVIEPLKFTAESKSRREALADSVLRDIRGSRTSLTMMQVAMTRAWDKQAEYGGLLEAYDRIGGVDLALADLALDAEKQIQQPMREALFARLVRIGEVGAVRRRASRSEFSEDQWEKLHALASDECGRLVVIGGEGNEAWVEITHESLITSWPWLQEFVTGQSDTVRLLEQLSTKAKLWNGRFFSDQIERYEYKKFHALVVSKFTSSWLRPKESRILQFSALRWAFWVGVLTLAGASVLAFGVKAQYAAEAAEQAKIAAEQATERTEDTLVGTYYRAIGESEVLSFDEQEVLWELAQLDQRYEAVREKLIGLWHESEASLSRSSVFGRRAAEGLRAAVRQTTATNATKLADELLAAFRKTPEIDMYRLIPLGDELIALSATMKKQDAERMAEHLLADLELEGIEVLERATIQAKILSALAKHIDPRSAIGTVDRLLDAIENLKQSAIYRLPDLSILLTSFAERIDPKDAARPTSRLLTALENSQVTDSARMAKLGSLLPIFAARMAHADALRAMKQGSRSLLSALKNVPTNDLGQLLDLGEVLVNLTLWLELKDASSAASQGLELVLPRFENATIANEYYVVRFVSVVSAFAASMGSDSTAGVAEKAMKVIEANTEQSGFGATFTGAMSNLAVVMTPKDAAREARSILKIIENPDEADIDLLQRLSAALAKFAKQMNTADVEEIANRLFLALHETEDLDRLESLTHGLSAMETPLSHEDAAKAADRLLMTFKMYEADFDHDRLDYLRGVFLNVLSRIKPQDTAEYSARFLETLESQPYEPLWIYRLMNDSAAQIKPDDASRVAQKLLATLILKPSSDTFTPVELGGALDGLLSRMKPSEAANMASLVVDDFLSKMKLLPPSRRSERPILGLVVAQLARYIPETKQIQAYAMSYALIYAIPEHIEGQHDDPPRKQMINWAATLDPQELSEVLKWPFCVGEAEQIVLTELENKTHRKFHGDVWQFVAAAESLGITDIDAPAKRPLAPESVTASAN